MSESDSVSLASSEDDSRSPSEIVEEEPLYYILNKFFKTNDKNIVDVLNDILVELKQLNINMSAKKETA